MSEYPKGHLERKGYNPGWLYYDSNWNLVVIVFWVGAIVGTVALWNFFLGK